MNIGKKGMVTRGTKFIPRIGLIQGDILVKMKTLVHIIHTTFKIWQKFNSCCRYFLKNTEILYKKENKLYTHEFKV